MTDTADLERHQHRVRRRALVRLGIFGGLLALVAVSVVVGGVLDIDRAQLQEDIRDFGPLAPFAFVVISGVLGALFVPGPVFAVLSTALFGVWLGIPLGIAGAVVCALICREVGSHMGREAAEEIAGARLGQLTAWLDRYGLSAVIAFRLMPAMPDAPLNYAAGLTRLKRWQVGLGTAIGVIPRTLGWGLVGATVGGASAWLATAGGALIIGADAGGAIAAVLVARHLGITPRVLWRKLRGAPVDVQPHGRGKGRSGLWSTRDGGLRPGRLGGMRIAIDGPAGAGKSTVARLVAERLDYTYLDTGAMYRAAALASLRGSDTPGEVDVSFAPDGEVLLAGEDVSLLIRTPEVTSLASKLAADPEVRVGLVERQRALMSHGDWVAEGRDVGTVVVPDAELKVYLDADPFERAQRRAAQLGADVNEVLAQQTERDERDRTRESSPLKAAEDAVILDTTGLSIEQVVEEIAAMALARSTAG